MFSLVFFLALIDSEASSEYFQYLYMRFHEKMFYMAMRLCKDEMKAEDAVQETFYRLATKEDQLEWLMSFRNTEKEAYSILFMCRQIMLNMMNQVSAKHEELSSFNDEEIRAYSSCRNFIVEDSLYDGVDEAELCGESDSSRKMAWAMNQLPPEYSNMLMMFYYYKFPIERIAKDLGLDKKNIYVKKSRALKKLKEIYMSADEKAFEVWGENN